MPRYRKQFLGVLLAAGLVFGQSGAGFAGMKGPPKPLAARADGQAKKEAAAASQPLLEAIRFFQEYISPTDGARCQFSPSCSAFGHQAIHRHGPVMGVVMTADRLMRCGYGTDAALYPRLPNGRLADPVAAMAREP